MLLRIFSKSRFRLPRVGLDKCDTLTWVRQGGSCPRARGLQCFGKALVFCVFFPSVSESSHFLRLKWIIFLLDFKSWFYLTFSNLFVSVFWCDGWVIGDWAEILTLNDSVTKKGFSMEPWRGTCGRSVLECLPSTCQLPDLKRTPRKPLAYCSTQRLGRDEHWGSQMHPWFYLESMTKARLRPEI